MKIFNTKSAALKCISQIEILCNEDIKKYFILPNTDAFINLIENSECPCYYEFISENSPVNLFFDIEINQDKTPREYEQHVSIITGIKETLFLFFTELQFSCKFVILESHSISKKSYHIILHLQQKERSIYFTSAKSLKPFIDKLFPNYSKLKIVDLSVYREGLFRTYLSSKNNENRPLIKNNLSDNFEFKETFVCITSPPLNPDFDVIDISTLLDNSNFSNCVIESDEEDNILLPIQKDLTSKDKDTINKFVRKTFKYRPSDIREIILNHELNCINVNLNDTFCHNIDREHKSNHQYIVIDAYSARQKCHDIDCSDYKHLEIKIKDFPKEISEIILKCLKINKQEQELIQRAIQECKDYITQNFDENIEEIQFDRNEMVFKGNASNNNAILLKGKCNICKLEHHITNTGYCLKCSVCHSIFPKNQLIPVDDRYKNLNNFWMNYSQLINNGTVNININNFYNGEEEFSCDIQLDNSIFKNKEMTKLYNQILDGHKVVLLSQLMSKLEVDFKYTNSEWYFFNGSIWKADKESLEFRKRILKLSNNFNRIQSFYETRSAGESSNGNIIKNIKSLVNKLHKTGFEDDIIKGAKMYYVDENFIRNLNSKKHLVPFLNGVYDLLERKFRKTNKDDYINLTVNYNYDNAIRNPEVYEFINNIIPNKGVRDYVLKKMSECLNGDIPNTNFLMFIGDGANGKSQLLNLMKLAIGDLGEKVEVTLLTRKRNNANEANSEKIKLMHKRFAFLSEPEDGEKINIGLLKELTGSEEIVARGLYQEAVSFVMEAKLFLACNELPEIKGEDTALWRRIRVIDFPSRFVDEPKDSNEFKIDRTLPSRMREDISWRQTFINILIDYYYKDISEPIEVKLKTNEYREENNDFNNWLDENICYKENNILHSKDVYDSLCHSVYGISKINNNKKSKIKHEIQKWIRKKYPFINHLHQDTTFNGQKFKGWLHLTFIENPE
jgi:P4 family phage/plasmid primase-like protien